MSIPTAAFLDTSILDGQQYNFQSTALSTFIPACAKRSVKLLLPEPTEREIERHIRERSREAFSAGGGATQGPVPREVARPPAEHPVVRSRKWDVQRVANAEWSSFLKQFTVVKLGYEGLNLTKVMEWYEAAEAPFGQGKKRKEFPDALAAAMLEAYAKKEQIYVAVASADPDFKLACQRFLRSGSRDRSGRPAGLSSISNHAQTRAQTRFEFLP